MKLISTSSLARSFDLDPKELFRRLSAVKLIERTENRWILTAEGRKSGGQMKKAAMSGEYIVWPDNFNLDLYEMKLNRTLLSATDIGHHFGKSAQKINKIFSTLGWVEQQVEGWFLTMLGEGQGGVEFEASSGKQYVKWPSDIVEDSGLLAWLNPKEENSQQPKNREMSKVDQTKKERLNSRYPPKFSTMDGHLVRSISEKNIDDYLFNEKIVHAYEKPVPTKHGDLICDFYIPGGAKKGSHAVYIEFWGMQGDEDYEKRKKEKLVIYERAGLMNRLIQLEPAHLSDLESHMGKLLLKVAHLEVV